MVFILSALWWIRIRGWWKLPGKREWLWGNLSLILMGGDMFSKSLIQFSVVPSLFLSWGLCLHWRLLDTHKQVWLSLLWGHCSFLLAPGAHKVLSVPCKSLFPQSCGTSVIKSHWPKKSNSLGFSVPLLDPQVGKSIVGPRTFLTVWGFLWYNSFAVCGSSAWRLYGGANGNQDSLCHMLHVPSLLQPEPLSP